jgi:hypothetical protein
MRDDDRVIQLGAVLPLILERASSRSVTQFCCYCRWLATSSTALSIHPRIQHACILVGTAWLNLIEG